MLAAYVRFGEDMQLFRQLLTCVLLIDTARVRQVIALLRNQPYYPPLAKRGRTFNGNRLRKVQIVGISRSRSSLN